MLLKIVLLIKTKGRREKHSLNLNVFKLLYKNLSEVFLTSHFLKGLFKKPVKVPVDKIIFIYKVAVKGLP